MEVQKISLQLAQAIIGSKYLDGLGYHPLGLFYYREFPTGWGTIDNSSGECFVESFKSLGAAIEWLKMGDPDRDGYESFFTAADISEADVFEHIYLEYMAQDSDGYCPSCFLEKRVNMEFVRSIAPDGGTAKIRSFNDKILGQCPRCGYELVYRFEPCPKEKK